MLSTLTVLTFLLSLAGLQQWFLNRLIQTDLAAIDAQKSSPLPPKTPAANLLPQDS